MLLRHCACTVDATRVLIGLQGLPHPTGVTCNCLRFFFLNLLVLFCFVFQGRRWDAAAQPKQCLPITAVSAEALPSAVLFVSSL